MKLLNNKYSKFEQKILSNKLNLLILLIIIIIITTQIDTFIGSLLFISFTIIINNSYIENFELISLSEKSKSLAIAQLSQDLENIFQKHKSEKIINLIEKHI